MTLKELLKESGLSQRAFALQTGYVQEHVNQVLGGHRPASLQFLFAAAAALEFLDICDFRAAIARLLNDNLSIRETDRVGLQKLIGGQA